MADKNLRSRKISTEDENYTNKDISKQISEMRLWMEKQFNSMAEQIDKVSKRVTSLEKEQAEQARSLTFYGEEIQELKQAVAKIVTERDTLALSNVSFTRLSNSMNKMEQERKLKTLIIEEVPVTNKENLNKLMEKLSDSLGVSFSTSDIDSIFRVKPKEGSSRPPAIIVKFNNMNARDALYDGRKRMVKNNVTTKSLGINESDSRVYINEQLSKDELELFYKARERKKVLSYKYAWTYHGHIFMRKEKSSEAIRINTSKDLIDLR